MFNFTGCHLYSWLPESYSPTFNRWEEWGDFWIESGVSPICFEQGFVRNSSPHHLSEDILSKSLVIPPINYLLVGGGGPLGFLCLDVSRINHCLGWWRLPLFNFSPCLCCVCVWYVWCVIWCLFHWCPLTTGVMRLRSCMVTITDHFLWVDRWSKVIDDVTSAIVVVI